MSSGLRFLSVQSNVCHAKKIDLIFSELFLFGKVIQFSPESNAYKFSTFQVTSQIHPEYGKVKFVSSYLICEPNSDYEGFT